MQCEFGVRVFEQIEAYPSGAYWSPIFSFGAIGAESLGQAESMGLAAVRREGQNRTAHAACGDSICKLRASRALRFEVQHFCSHCRTAGIEPGFKRKPCSQCGGLGVCAIP